MTSPSTNTDSKPTYHIAYPFNIEGSQGGLFSAAQVTTASAVPSPFEKLVIHASDSEATTLNGVDVRPVAPLKTDFPAGPWFTHDFLFQHLQAHTEMMPPWLAKEIFRDGGIANPGSVEYVNEFFKRHPVDFSTDEGYSARYKTILSSLKAGDTIGIQGPVWLMPFIRDNADEIRRMGVKHVQFEHQLIPERLDQTPLGARILPVYQKADTIFFHTSVYADRLANMLKGRLPEMKTVDLGIDQQWLDAAQKRVSQLSDVPAQNLLTDRQTELLEAVFRAKATIPHKFICFDRLDPMKGTHAVIGGIKLFLDEARAQEGEAYKTRYQFASIHELLQLNSYHEFSPKDQYARVCKQMYADLQAAHPGVVLLSESFTSKNGHRDVLPTLMRGRTAIALLGQDGLGLSALEASYVNRNEDVGLIVGDQAGCYLEAKKRGWHDLVHGVTAGDPVAVKDAIWQVVRMRERAPGTLAENNARFAQGYVIPRRDTMVLS